MTRKGDGGLDVTTWRYRRLGVGLARVLQPGFPPMLWTSLRVRTVRACACCGATIPIGTRAWRPVSNLNNRWHRLCDWHFPATKEKA